MSYKMARNYKLHVNSSKTWAELSNHVSQSVADAILFLFCGKARD